MRYRVAKKIADRIDGEGRISAVTYYRDDQARRAVVALRRRWLRGTHTRARWPSDVIADHYCITDDYYRANRLESVIFRWWFFPWRGRGEPRLYVERAKDEKRGRGYRRRRYVGMPYTPNGKLVLRKGMQRPAAPAEARD